MSDDTNVAYVVELLQLSFRTTKQNKLEKHININMYTNLYSLQHVLNLNMGVIDTNFRNIKLTIGTIVSKILRLTSETNGNLNLLSFLENIDIRFKFSLSFSLRPNRYIYFRFNRTTDALRSPNYNNSWLWFGLVAGP